MSSVSLSSINGRVFFGYETFPLELVDPACVSQSDEEGISSCVDDDLPPLFDLPLLDKNFAMNSEEFVFSPSSVILQPLGCHSPVVFDSSASSSSEHDDSPPYHRLQSIKTKPRVIKFSKLEASSGCALKIASRLYALSLLLTGCLPPRCPYNFTQSEWDQLIKEKDEGTLVHIKSVQNNTITFEVDRKLDIFYRLVTLNGLNNEVSWDDTHKQMNTHSRWWSSSSVFAPISSTKTSSGALLLPRILRHITLPPSVISSPYFRKLIYRSDAAKGVGIFCYAILGKILLEKPFRKNINVGFDHVRKWIMLQMSFKDACEQVTRELPINELQIAEKITLQNYGSSFPLDTIMFFNTEPTENTRDHGEGHAV